MRPRDPAVTRILHLISSNQRRGAETFGVELGSELGRRGHLVDVAAVAGSPVGPFLDVEVAGRSRLDPLGFASIVRRARQADVVVSFGSISLQAAAAAAAVARRPFVYRNIGDPTVWGAVRGADLRIGAPLRRASHVVAVFPRAKDVLVSRYRLDPDKVSVIPRGVPAERFPVASETDRARARAELGLDPERPWVAYVGSLTEEKDPLLALAAVAHLPDVGIVVCGDGPLADSLAADSRLPSERKRILGPVDDVRPVMAACDALLLSSQTEGVPGVAIEAGLSGLPVVAPNVGGIPFVVIDGETGILVDGRAPSAFGDAIAEALRSPRLGAAAAQRTREVFSMASVAAAWESRLAAVVQAAEAAQR